MTLNKTRIGTTIIAGLTVFFSFFSSLTTFGQTYYVKSGGSGTGASWDSPFGTITQALAAPHTANSTVNIYVAAGTYALGTGSYALPNDHNLIIKGGYPTSATGTDISGYDRNANTTTLTGNASAPLFSAGGSYTRDVSLIGFNITNCTYANRSTDPTIGICGIFQAGTISTLARPAATYNFTQLNVYNNGTEGRGRGLFSFNKLRAGSIINFDKCFFGGTSTAMGNKSGCIYINNGSSDGFSSILNISNSSFQYNYVDFTEDGGAALTLVGSNANDVYNITNSTFCNNTNSQTTSNGIGGAIYQQYGALNIDGSQFNSNIAGTTGGAIHSINSAISCTNTIFNGNSVIRNVSYGGAVYASVASGITNSTSHFDGCTFYANTTAGSEGGAIFIDGNSSTTNSFTANNSKFFNNSSTNTSGASGGAIYTTNKCTGLSNTVFSGNYVGASTTAATRTNATDGSDLKFFDKNNYNTVPMFTNVSNSTFQLPANAAAYNGVTGTAETSTWGSGNLFSQTAAVTAPTTNCPTANVVLPVTFGNISATIKNAQLAINWQTITETNNSYFKIQISKDGNNFETISTVQSKAVNGNSDVTLEYEYSVSFGTMGALFAVPLVLLSLAFGIRKKRNWVCAAAVMIVISSGFFACKKSNEPVHTNNTKPFVRIIQVDINGKEEASKVVTAVVAD